MAFVPILFPFRTSILFHLEHNAIINKPFIIVEM